MKVGKVNTGRAFDMRKLVTLILLAGMVSTLITGCTKEKMQEWVAPLTAEIYAQEGAVDEKKEEKESGEPLLIPEIDTSIRIKEGISIAVVGRTKKGAYWKELRNGMKKAVADINAAYGFDKDKQVTLAFDGPDSDTDVENQINILDAVLSENPDVLCVAPIDKESCQAQLEVAAENNIPVIAFDSNVESSDLVTAYRAVDNHRIGEVGAYRLAVAIGKMGKVAVFSGSRKNQSNSARIKGFQDFISAYGDIEIVRIVSKDEVEDMTMAIQEVLEQYPTLAGVFCTDAETSELYLSIQKEETRDAVAMIGVEATQRQQEAVKKGEEIGVIAQSSYAVGYHAIWAAVCAASRMQAEELPNQILLPPVWITRDNIEDPSLADYLLS